MTSQLGSQKRALNKHFFRGIFRYRQIGVRSSEFGVWGSPKAIAQVMQWGYLSDRDYMEGGAITLL